MIKRKPFFIRGNFQLVFILSYVLILAAGVLCDSALIYHMIKGILERAAFSSHLNLDSSGDLFWGTILKVNFLLSCAIIAVGLLAITTIYVYLESFFATLSQGLEKLAAGKVSFRLRRRRLPGMRSFTKDFNEAAHALEKEAADIRAGLEWILSALNSPTRESFHKIKKEHLRIIKKLSKRAN